jgi:hypothetical protein
MMLDQEDKAILLQNTIAKLTHALQSFNIPADKIPKIAQVLIGLKLRTDHKIPANAAAEAGYLGIRELPEARANSQTIKDTLATVYKEIPL